MKFDVLLLRVPEQIQAYNIKDGRRTRGQRCFCFGHRDQPLERIVGKDFGWKQSCLEAKCHWEEHAAQHAEVVENLVKEARKALKAKGRAADLQMTTIRKDIVLRLQMIGYRQLLQNYFKGQVSQPQ